MKKLNLKYIAIIAIIAFCSFIVANSSKIIIDNGVDFAVLNMENPPGNHPFLSLRVNSETLLGMYLERNGRLIIGTVDPCPLVIPNDTVKLVVHGEAWKTGAPFWEGISDARLKNGIIPMNKSLEKFLDINFRRYEYNDQPGRMWYGVLAQEYYSFNPNNLIFTAMKVIQELAQRLFDTEEQVRELEADLEAERRRNNQQQEEIDAIKSALAQHGIKIPKPATNTITKPNSDPKPPVTTHKRMSVGNDTPRLEQNIPNPFTQSTMIPYYLPEGTRNAVLSIHDIAGKTVAEHTLLSEKGEGKIQVNVDDVQLNGSIYTYSLYVNNRLIDTKKMILSTTK